MSEKHVSITESLYRRSGRAKAHGKHSPPSVVSSTTWQRYPISPFLPNFTTNDRSGVDGDIKRLPGNNYRFRIDRQPRIFVFNVQVAQFLPNHLITEVFCYGTIKVSCFTLGLYRVHNCAVIGQWKTPKCWKFCLTVYLEKVVCGGNIYAYFKGKVSFFWPQASRSRSWLPEYVACRIISAARLGHQRSRGLLTCYLMTMDGNWNQ